jgi:hypothetical protein
VVTDVRFEERGESLHVVLEVLITGFDKLTQDVQPSNSELLVLDDIWELLEDVGPVFLIG